MTDDYRLTTKIKICGLTNADNAQQVLALKPAYMGFIFYDQSKRFVGRENRGWIRDINGVIKTGVFVNAPVAEILIRALDLRLGALQLHGDESPEVCRQLKEDTGLQLIKAFGIGSDFEWSALTAYQNYVDFFLFDTQSVQYGGTGKKFDWGLLSSYALEKPYFLSGGMNPDNIGGALLLEDPRLYALDLNSGFETSPGIKNIDLLTRIM